MPCNVHVYYNYYDIVHNYSLAIYYAQGIWLAVFFLIEGRSIQSHAERNKIVGERWRQMSEEEKEPYYERAKEGTNATRSQPEKSWKEASRIIRNLESNVCTYM